MDKTVTLDEVHFETAQQNAQVRGMTAQEYVQSLVDADSKTFDQTLEPVRNGFDQTSDSELDDLFDRALQASRQTK